MPILDSAANNGEIETKPMEEFDEETLKVIKYLENENLSRLIDDALLERNEELFYNLLHEKQRLNEEFYH